MPLWKMTLPFLSKARAYFPCSWIRAGLVTCFNGESVAEVTETTLDVKFFEHERPHGREELEDASKTERDREQERGKEELAASSRFRNPICSPGHVSEIVWDTPTIVELSNAYSFMNDSRRD